MRKGEILCLHSSGLSGAQFSKLAQALSANYEVRTPDLLGYGGCADPYQNPFHYRQDLQRLLGMLERPSFVIGHSYGGFLALQLALRVPSLVTGLAVFDPIAWGALLSSTGRDPNSIVEDPRFAADDTEPEDWLESFVDFWGESGSWRAISGRARRAMLDSYPKLREEVRSLVGDRTPHTEYEAIACPTLLLTGRQSPMAQQEVVRILNQAIPHSEFAITGGGHMGPITNAAEFQEKVETFLQRQSAP